MSLVSTVHALLLLVQLVLVPCEMSGLGGEDEQESLVSALANTVAVQSLVVPRQPLPDHPALQRRGELKLKVDLCAGNKDFQLSIVFRFSNENI